jgi:dCTP deaminase
MILSDGTLLSLLPQLIKTNLDESLVNPASIDIRIGEWIMLESTPPYSHTFDILNKGYTTISSPWKSTNNFFKYNIGDKTKDNPQWIYPGTFFLAETMEHIHVPNGYCMELKLKSSRAREGYNHSLAFWVDPGWDGVLTMELQNITQNHALPIYPGLKIAQLIYHKMDAPAIKPYEGKYQNSNSVSASRDK